MLAKKKKGGFSLNDSIVKVQSKNSKHDEPNKVVPADPKETKEQIISPKKNDDEYRIIHRSEFCIYTAGLNDLQ
jgi:hypothetical protein